MMRYLTAFKADRRTNNAIRKLFVQATTERLFGTEIAQRSRAIARKRGDAVKMRGR